MIVPMKKATVIVRRDDRPDALRRLRKLGVLHLSAVPAQVPSAQEWREKKALLEKALAAISLPQGGPSGAAKRTLGTPSPGIHECADMEAALAATRTILDRQDAIRALNEEAEELKKEALRLQEWEGVSLAELRPIQDQGYEVKFYEVPSRQLDLIPPEYSAFVIRRAKALRWVALVVERGVPVDIEFKPLEPPRRGAAELKSLQAGNRSNLHQFRRELEQLGGEASRLERAVRTAGREIELAEAAAAMGHTAALSYLSGFLPAEQAEALKGSCRCHGWALLLQDPAADEEVPTIVRNKRWIGIIRPVFQLLGTIPGYREFDISFFFLIFLSFFFATIIGDAGYGAIIFSVSLFLVIRSRSRHKSPPAISSLMLIFSFTTMIWGALTGTWFASEKLAAAPCLSWMTVPALSSLNPASGDTIKHIFFIVGTLHIAIAHAWSFIRQAKKKPFIRSLAQLGWLSMVLGLYYLVLNLVLSSVKYPMPMHALCLIAAGFLSVIIFSRQEGRFFYGVAMGFAHLLTTFLNSISAFSDIISYIRLFAVGLAGLAIERTFNAMAASLGTSLPGIIVAGIILLLGHSLNLAMGSLSVIVHGVRLNMLEFSGHLGMEWTGKPYKPFKE